MGQANTQTGVHHYHHSFGMPAMFNTSIPGNTWVVMPERDEDANFGPSLFIYFGRSIHIQIGLSEELLCLVSEKRTKKLI